MEGDEPTTSANSSVDMTDIAAAGARMPPPPSSSIPGPSSDARRAAALAAAAAAARAAPAQRERIIEQAAAQAFAEHSQRRQVSDAASREPAGPNGTAPTANQPPQYQPPPWAGVPQGVPYTIEVLKTGTIVEQRDINTKDHYTFGRSPDADFVLEHPTCSRLHAVLQFDARTHKASLYDCGSAHGTFVNKTRIAPQTYVPLEVGYTMKFGGSSRVYIFGGPQELQPPEGLSRQQKLQLQKMQAASETRKKKEEHVAQSQMQAALTGAVTWGMAEDAVIDPTDLEDIDWRAYAASQQLTDKQQKLVEKVRAREYKIANLRKEIDRILAKEKMEGSLTQGQTATLARNEQAIDAAMSEMEDLEESLTDSIRDALRDKLREKERNEPNKKRKASASDDEYEGSESEDEFYDRTTGPSAAGTRKKAKVVEKPQVESAETLYGKKAALQDERQRILDEIKAEEAAVAKLAATARAAPADAPQNEMQESSNVADQAGEGVDALDAFMTDMTKKVEEDKLTGLRKQLEETDRQLQRCDKLLKIADPDGWFKPDSKVAVKAKESALKALEEQRKRAAAAAEKKRKQEDTSFTPEEEEDTDRATASVPGDTLASAPLLTTTTHASAAVPAVSSIKKPMAIPMRKPILALNKPQSSNPEPPKSHANTSEAAQAAAAQLIQELGAPRHEELEEARTRRKEMLAAANKQQQAASKNTKEAEAKILEDLALLRRAHVRAEDLDADAEWQAPAGQSGDGKTALNERLGY